MQTNKIIQKHFLPRALISGTIIAAIFTTGTCYGINKIQESKEVNTQSLVVYLIAVIGLLTLSAPIVYDYKNSKRFAANIAYKHIKKNMEEHPELKLFEKVLENPRALNSVATMLSNSLIDSEQKRVLDIVLATVRHDYSSESEEIAALMKAQGKIMQILQEHASIHPEFINDLYYAMAKADATYVIPSQQFTR